LLLSLSFMYSVKFNFQFRLWRRTLFSHIGSRSFDKELA
jgi:hypothetical protein